MKRIIVDYKKLTPEILNLLVDKFPDGYGIRDIIKFTNAMGKYVEAVEVSTEDTIYLVKISDELVDSMENFPLANDDDDLNYIDESEGIDFGEVKLDEDLDIDDSIDEDINDDSDDDSDDHINNDINDDIDDDIDE